MDNDNDAAAKAAAEATAKASKAKKTKVAKSLPGGPHNGDYGDENDAMMEI